MGSMLKLCIVYEKYGWQLESKSQLPKKQIGFLRGATASEGRRSVLKKIAFKLLAKLKMLGW